MVGLGGDYNKNIFGWSPQHRLYAFAVLFLLFIHTLTITLDVLDPEVYSSITLLGDDVCIMLGVNIRPFLTFQFVYGHVNP